MAIQENKEICRRLFETVWNEGNAAAIPDFHTPDFTVEDPYNPTTGKGPDAAKKYLTSYKRSLPDLHFRIENQVAEGDWVVNFLSATGTHDGELLGFPPTHKKATVNAIVTLRLKNGKICESTAMWDALSFMRSVGIELTPELAGSRR